LEIKKVINPFANQQEKKIHWGTAFSMWEISRHKVVGIPVLDLFLKHVKDNNLKLLIQNGIDLLAMPHVEKIQNFMKEHDLTYPALPPRDSFDDQQISRAIIEILRLSLLHENYAYMSTTKESERNLIWNIIKDDRIKTR